MNLEIARAKAALRRRQRHLRVGLQAAGATASAEAAERAPVPIWRNYGVVAGYLAVATEIDPAPLLSRLAVSGARIVLPVVVERRGPLVFRDRGDAADHQLDAAGMPAPPPTAEAADPDLVIAPLLAFDRFGGRLGYGGGYYDRTIKALRVRGRTTVVGLAYAGQEVEMAPREPWDELLDAVLTETGYREF